MNRVLCLLATLSSLCSPATRADDVESLRAAIHRNAFLLAGNVDIVQVGARRYLVSVGLSAVRSAEPSARVAAIRLSRLAAEEGLMRYIYPSEVEITETLKITKQATREPGAIRRQRDEVLATTIRDHSAGGLPPVIEIEAWYGNSDHEYFCALALLVPD